MSGIDVPALPRLEVFAMWWFIIGGLVALAMAVGLYRLDPYFHTIGISLGVAGLITFAGGALVAVWRRPSYS